MSKILRAQQTIWRSPRSGLGSKSVRAVHAMRVPRSVPLRIISRTFAHALKTSILEVHDTQHIQDVQYPIAV